MSTDDWSDIEEVPAFLEASDWKERIGCLSKSQSRLIAEYLELHIAKGTKKCVLLLKIVNTVKASKGRKGSDFLNELLMLEQQVKLQEKEVEKLKIQAQMQEQAHKDNELERARETERKRHMKYK